MTDRLQRYQQLRDFAATPEPAGDLPPAPPADQPRFVIQQHDATRLHWDLRLEHEGVLASWALPRGVPWNPEENRLAVRTEDHPLEYLDFHGEIPAGQYGAGTMAIWDRGRYEASKFTDREVVVSLHGSRVAGAYALFPIRDRDWMIHRMDPPQDPERLPLPDGLEPMTGVVGGLPADPERWAFEIRWSGARVLASNDAGHVTITHHGGDITTRLPDLRRMGRVLGAVEVVLDAVVVGLDREGRPSADAAVERRLAARDERQARRLAQEQPVATMLVDLLWLEGHPVTGLPYEDRRTLLFDLRLDGPSWQSPRHHVGEGPALITAARAQGLRGLVAKRLGSPYCPGETTDDWILVEA